MTGEYVLSFFADGYSKADYQERSGVMGWGDCGTDSKGRPIGYVHPAKCDRPGCDEDIDRGLSYVCGRMHGSDEYSCEGYFCEQHRTTVETPDGEFLSLCDDCLGHLEVDEDMRITDGQSE